MNYRFPFGSQLSKVEQKDKSPKKVFVLGVYASAVHARWIGQDGQRKVTALAVASEPEIFWHGDGAKEIIDGITVPSELGHLEPAEKRFNGPSGNVLDELFLLPLGYAREDAWLCDLLPYTRINPNQAEAIRKHYNPSAERLGLPECNIPKFSPQRLTDHQRRNEILQELQESKAETLVLLGDLPIKWFLSYHTNNQYTKLSDFVKIATDYGKSVPIIIAGATYNVIPLVHPRQAGKLGKANAKWTQLHHNWVDK